MKLFVTTTTDQKFKDSMPASRPLTTCPIDSVQAGSLLGVTSMEDQAYDNMTHEQCIEVVCRNHIKCLKDTNVHL